MVMGRDPIAERLSSFKYEPQDGVRVSDFVTDFVSSGRFINGSYWYTVRD